jgi:hypothetical protein
MEPAIIRAVMALRTAFDTQDVAYDRLPRGVVAVQAFRSLGVMRARERLLPHVEAIVAAYSDKTRDEIQAPRATSDSGVLREPAIMQPGYIPILLYTAETEPRSMQPLVCKQPFSNNKEQVQELLCATHKEDCENILVILDLLNTYIPADTGRCIHHIQKRGTTVDIRISADADIDTAVFDEIADACEYVSEIVLEPSCIRISILAASPIRTSAYKIRATSRRQDRRTCPYSRP